MRTRYLAEIGLLSRKQRGHRWQGLPDGDQIKTQQTRVGHGLKTRNACIKRPILLQCTDLGGLKPCCTGCIGHRESTFLPSLSEKRAKRVANW
jgi:hypothetical protein